MSTASAQAFFDQKNVPNHRLIKRFVGMARSYDWRKDKSLLILRDVLGMRTYIRSSFINAISSVTQCLVSFAQYTPVSLGNGQRALFVIPDQIYISTIAKYCNVSRHTVYRVLDYLAAIGDCETVTTFSPETKTYSPTKIVLNGSLFTRMGMPFDELQKAIQSLVKHAKEDLKDKREKTKFITSRLVNDLRPSIKRRLGANTEKILAQPNIINSKITLIQNPSFLPDNIPNNLNTSIKSSFVNKDRKSNAVETGTTKPKEAPQVDPRYVELRNSGLSVTEANKEYKKIILAGFSSVKKSK